MPKELNENVTEEKKADAAAENTDIEYEAEVDMEDDEDEESAEQSGEDEAPRTDEDFKKEVLPVVKSEITEEEAEEFAKISAFEDAFMRRSIQIPGKRKRRATFKDDEAIIGDENHEMDTLGSAKKREYDLLSDSAKATKPKVLWGRVFGIEE